VAYANVRHKELPPRVFTARAAIAQFRGDMGGLQPAHNGYGDCMGLCGADEDSTTDSTAQWFRRARFACEPFMFAAARFRTPWVDDEFAATIGASRQWLRDNPCPDASLGQHFTSMLDDYGEMTYATVARVMELRANIERYVEALERWKPVMSRLPGRASADPTSTVPRERREVVRMSAEHAVH
jgi:hypothetical protein